LAAESKTIFLRLELASVLLYGIRVWSLVS
jgi:hypothetical protein